MTTSSCKIFIYLVIVVNVDVSYVAQKEKEASKNDNIDFVLPIELKYRRDPFS